LKSTSRLPPGWRKLAREKFSIDECGYQPSQSRGNQSTCPALGTVQHQQGWRAQVVFHRKLAPNIDRPGDEVGGDQYQSVFQETVFDLRGALISSLSASWRGSDSIRVLLFSLTLRSGRAILRYYPRLLSSWLTSSTDAPRLWSIPEAVESSFPLRLQPCHDFTGPDPITASILRLRRVARSTVSAQSMQLY
jgi:hypothetical protein